MRLGEVSIVLREEYLTAWRGEGDDFDAGSIGSEVVDDIMKIGNIWELYLLTVSPWTSNFGFCC